MGTYNPHSPYVLGMQWPPVNRDQVLLDSSVEVGYSFRAVVDRGSVDGISMVRLLTTMPPAGRAERQELVAAISRAGRVGGTGPIRKVVIGCREGEHVSGSSTVPVSAVHEAVRSPADGSYVRLTGPDAGTRFWFDTAAVLPELAGRRILDVTVLYSITGPFVEYPGGVTIGMERPSVGSFWVMDDSVTGAAVSTGQSQIYRARLGELSPYGLASDMNPDSTTTRLPWHHLILADMHASGGNLNVRVSTSGTVSGGVEFDIQYVALEVTYCEETREAAGGLDIGMAGGPQLAAGGRLWYYDIPVFDTRYLDYGASVDRGDEYVVTIGRAYSGSTLGQSATPIPVDRLGSLDPFVSHQGVVVRKALREGASHQVEQTDLMPAAVLLADGSADAGSHAYVTQRPAALHFDNAGSFTQLLSGDGAGTYVWGRFYARRAEGTNQPLSLFQVPVDAPSTPPSDDAITYVTPDEVDRLPELVNGWRDVIVRLAQPVVIEDGETTRWRFRSLTNAASPWEVLGADTDPGSLDGLDLGAAVSYGGVQAHADFESEDDSSADLVLSLAREMDTVTGLVVVEQVQPLMVVDPDCVVPVDGIPTGIHYHRLTWEPVNSEVVAGFGSPASTRRGRGQVDSHLVFADSVGGRLEFFKVGAEPVMEMIQKSTPTGCLRNGPARRSSVSWPDTTRGSSIMVDLVRCAEDWSLESWWR